MAVLLSHPEAVRVSMLPVELRASSVTVEPAEFVRVASEGVGLLSLGVMSGTPPGGTWPLAGSVSVCRP
jgi:hypothetical protein